MKTYLKNQGRQYIHLTRADQDTPYPVNNN